MPFIWISIMAVSCSTYRHSTKSNQNIALTINKNIDSLKAVTDNLPTKEQYKAMRDAFLNRVNGILVANEKIRKLQNRSGKTFSKVSFFVGGAGGLVGLFAKDSQIGSISSLLVGVIGGLALDGYSKDEEDKSSACFTLITRVKANFEATWPEFKVPSTQAEYIEFMKDIKSGSDAIGNANCFAINAD